MGGGDLPFSWGVSIRHRRTATGCNEDNDNSDDWTVLDNSKDRRRNHMWVTHQSLYRTVTSVVVVVEVLSIVVAT